MAGEARRNHHQRSERNCGLLPGRDRSCSCCWCRCRRPLDVFLVATLPSAVVMLTVMYITRRGVSPFPVVAGRCCR